MKKRRTEHNFAGFANSSKKAIFALLIIAAALTVYSFAEAAVVSHPPSAIQPQGPAGGFDAATLNGLSSAAILAAGGGGWTVTGTNVYKTDVSGNVGIGTTNPGATLDVLGNGSGTTEPPTAIFTHSGNEGYLDAVVKISAQSAMGTYVNEGALSIENPGNTRRALAVYSNWGTEADTPLVQFTADNAAFDTPVLHLKQDGTGYGLIVEGGNVGIGTTTPGYKLDVSAPAGEWKARFAGSDGYILIGPANSGWAHIYTDRPNFIFDKPVYTIGNAFSSYSTGDLSLQTGGTTRIFMRNSDGSVGIGTTSPGPGAKLDVAGQVKITGGSPGAGKVLTSDASGLASWQVPAGGIGGSGTDNYIPRWSGTSALENSAIYQTDTGKVGIGTTDPKSTLDVNGGVRIGSFTSSPDTRPTCDVNTIGTLIFDTTQGKPYVCMGTSWSPVVYPDPIYGSALDPGDWTTLGSATHPSCYETVNLPIGSPIPATAKHAIVILRASYRGSGGGGDPSCPTLPPLPTGFLLQYAGESVPPGITTQFDAVMTYPLGEGYTYSTYTYSRYATLAATGTGKVTVLEGYDGYASPNYIGCKVEFDLATRQLTLYKKRDLVYILPSGPWVGSNCVATAWYW